MFVLEICSDPNLQKIIKLLKSFIGVIQLLIPMGLILMGTIDLGKAVIASNEDDIKKGQKKFMRRAIAAIIVYLVVAIVSFLMGFIGNDEWKNCWNPTTSIEIHEEFYRS